MINLLKKVSFNLLLVLLCFSHAYGQIESPDTRTMAKKEDISCFYMIDRVYTDPRNPDKRTVVGGVNFFQVENGMISVAAMTPKKSFNFTGSIDSLETDVVDNVPVMRIYATNNFNSITIYPYIFEISQNPDQSIVIHAHRQRSVAYQYYFDVHKASAKEIADTRVNASK
nr:hypothetical protein [uncultured Fluviicola sp.]